ncbi:MAG: AMIN domain-containing protein [Deltaproteobacteria bacterium]|nr:AMIN domain-containing protein [Candidatus Zymogenaceae bacterium]
MKIKGRLFFAVVISSTLILAPAVLARADASRDLMDTAQKKYETLLKSEKRRSSKSMWLEVINAFDLVVKQYPNSREAPRALFSEACIWREMFNYSITLGELYRAEATFKKFIKTYPNHELAADARKNIEEIQNQKKNNSLINVSTAKPDPEKFPGRKTALKTDENAGTNRTQKKDPIKDQKKDTKKTAGSPAVSSPSIEKIRYFTDANRTRIVVDLDATISFKDAALPQDKPNGIPPRIYVDLVGARASSGLYCPLTVKDGLVSRIRWSNKEDGVRVVLDLEKKADYTVFPLTNPHRLVIDVLRN